MIALLLAAAPVAPSVPPPSPAVVAVSPPPADPARLAAADRLLAITRQTEVFHQIIPKLIDVFVAQLAVGNPGHEEEIKRIIADEFSGTMLLAEPSFRAFTRNIYAEHFSVAELDSLADFYRTKVGEKVLTELPAMSVEMMAFGRNVGVAAAQAALPRILERMRALKLHVPDKT